MIHYIDLIKAHVKAHFRMNKKTGKMEFIHDYDDARHAADLHVAYEQGDRVRIDNPKSAHHGKEGVFQNYDPKYGDMWVKVEGHKLPRTAFKPHHLEHVDESRRPGAVKKADDNPFGESPEKKPGKKPEEKPAQIPQDKDPEDMTHDELIAEIKRLRAEKDKPKENTGEGNTKTVYTAKDDAVKVQYAVRDLNDLVTSHTAEGAVNPAYPQELQPRDRDKLASKYQIAKISNNLNPDLLGDSSKVSDGAPIIGEDNVVESGNGRTLAIADAYQRGDAGHYKQWLKDNARDFGLDPKSIEGMKTPVLVRVRKTDVDRAEFARAANQADVASMGPTEQAKSDAKRISDDSMALLSVPETGNLLAPSNREFVKDFLRSIGTNEASQYITKDGGYTKQLADRLQAAVFAKAYDDDRLVSIMAESSDSDIKGIVTALSTAAPDFAKAKSIAGHLDGMDVIPHVVGATEMIRKARGAGMSLSQYIGQQNMFQQPHPDTVWTAQCIEANVRSPKRMADMFQTMARFIGRQMERSGTMNMFAAARPPDARKVIDAANKEIEKISGQAA